MEVMAEQDQAIFRDAGQAVHVAFLVMAQEAMQDAPFRKALIRAMESIHLDKGQTHWLDQLRGEKSGAINFEGLSGGEVRAQCAMITQAVKTNLPPVERWVLQAKYGETEFEDVADGGDEIGAAATLERALEKVRSLRLKLTQAQAELNSATVPRSGHSPDKAERANFESAATAVSLLRGRIATAESAVQVAQVAVGQQKACRALDNGPLPKGEGGVVTRRYAFSAERIAAITGLSDYFQPMFPRIKPLAMDVMLGRLFANHKKLDISTRDMAAQFGGNYKMYMRAGWKIKNQVRELEAMALDRLGPIFTAHGVIEVDESRAIQQKR
jgi:hypothetical protein